VLENQVALVTGASRGIGKAIAIALGKQGAIVIGTATSDNGAAAISDYLAAEKIQGCGLKLDVTNDADIEAVLKSIKERFSAVTILVNNAGVTKDNLLMRMKDQEWADVINTNLGSVFRLSRACLRDMMKARSGRIISIASVVGLSGNAGQTNYSASKSGMLGFTKSLAREVGSRGITVNAVAPGFVDTDRTRALADEQRQAVLKDIPLGRLGEAEDIAAAVAFLASPAAAYITGETINVNGGMLMN